MRNYFGFVLFIFVMLLSLVAVAVLPNNIFDTTNFLQYIDTNFACVCVYDELFYWNGGFSPTVPLNLYIF